jgi:hypothetical protein
MRKTSRPPSLLRHGCLLRAPDLSPGYALDVSDPDVLLLICPDGTTAAAFSVRGVTEEGILEAAGQDAWAANHSANRVGDETLSARNGRQT